MKKIFTLLTAVFILFNTALVAQSNTGCNADFSFSINQYNVSFVPAPNPDSALVKHYWNFGDGLTASGYAQSHTYALVGTYTVTHYVYKSGNTSGQISCIDSVKKQVVITQPCKVSALFSFVRDSIQSNVVHFYYPTTIANVTVAWNFGDGSVSSDINPTHTYAASGLYNVCLLVTVNGICKGDTCIKLQVQVPTTCNNTPYFTSVVDSIQYNKVHFINYSAPAITSADSVSWMFGDGTTSQSHNVTIAHTYNAPGNYKVCLLVKKIIPGSTVVCVREYCATVTVTAPVNTCDFSPVFTWTKDSTVTGYKINFSNASTSVTSKDSLVWNFGDGTPQLSAYNATHIYTQPGKYKVCLIVYRSANCVKYTCDSITIKENALPCSIVPSFIIKVDSVNKQKIYFTNTTSPITTANYSVVWSFGDGASGDGWNTSHTYTNPGKYYVCLRIALTGTTCVKYKCDSIIVLSNVPPCDITASYTCKVDSLNKKKILFTNTSVTTISAVPYATWSFGDGTSLNGWNVSHEYAKAGKYYVCLRIELPGTNCVKYKCDSVAVPEPIVTNCNALSVFNYTKASSDNQLYYFTPTYPATDVKYTWTFGDGTGSQNASTSHRYITSGTYNACLTAYRNNDCASTTCKPVSILQSNNGCDTASVRFEYKKDPVVLNKVNFYLISNVAVTQQSWTIAKMTTGAAPITLSQNNPYYYFGDTGYYRVCVRVITLQGCVKEYCDVIHIDAVTAPCVLMAYPNPSSTQITLNVQMTANGMIRGEIFNVQNLLVRSFDQSGVVGNNVLTVNIQTLPAGFYTVRLVYGNNVCYAKFQKF